MATSGTATEAFDWLQIIEEAYEQAGFELRTGYDLRTARRSLNLLTLEWANQGINFWTVESVSTTTTANTATKATDADTIDVLDVMIRENETDRILQRISNTAYANHTDKLSTGKPTEFWVDRGTSTTTLYFWKIPDQAYTLIYYRMRRIEDVGGYTNNADVPFRFIPALIAGLAYKLCAKNLGKDPQGFTRIPILQAEYNRLFMDAMAEDRSKTSLRLVPGR